MNALIVTGDKDLLQLVTDRVTLLLTRKGVTEGSGTTGKRFGKSIN